MNLILASASKRRMRILEECRIRFKAVPANVEEESNVRGGIARTVVHNARVKALKVSAETGAGEIILGADTLVLFGEEIIGKPAGRAEALELLERFSGGKLKVYTGLFVIDKSTGRSASGWEETDVRVKRLKKEEIVVYLKHLGAFDKAGGFSIEGAGALAFDDIRGSYYNVLGLPMAKLEEILREAGRSIFSFME
jgi:septum formation protein